MALKEKTEFGEAKQSPYDLEDFEQSQGKQIIRLDLACGQQKKKGWTGIDKQEIEGVDIVHNLLTFPWPFEDSSVYEMKCEHFVEHIPHQILTEHGVPYFEDGLVLFMEEVWRCLQPYGIITIVAPFYTSVRAWQDPTHCRAITDFTFHYFCQAQAKAAMVNHYMGKANFEILTKRLSVNPEFESKSEEAKRWAMRHYFNVIDDIEITLQAIK